MFLELKKKLIFVYTISTGVILTAVLGAAFFFHAASSYRQQETSFQNYLFTLSSQLQSNSVFSDSKLASLELQNRLLISIEENGHPLFFNGAYAAKTDRNLLIQRAESEARSEGISTASAPISSDMLRSSLFRIHGDNGDAYLASVLIARIDNGYKKLTLLADQTGFAAGLFATGFLYLLTDAAGIALLFFTGRRFVRRAIRPAEVSYEKQQAFVSAASHELRSPLAVIRTSASAIKDSPEHSSKLAETIQNECLRGGRLISSLLLLASADEGRLAVKISAFEIDELLLNLLEAYEPLCRSRGGNLLLKLPEEPLPEVTADEDLTRQILVILLDNAISYGLGHSQDKDQNGCSPSAAKIELSAHLSRKHISVSVTDHGPGLSDTEKGLIFDRFYRKDKSRNQKEHFGLGLSIAADLAALQKSDLRVEDTPGGGCTFILRL